MSETPSEEQQSTELVKPETQPQTPQNQAHIPRSILQRLRDWLGATFEVRKTDRIVVVGKPNLKIRIVLDILDLISSEIWLALLAEHAPLWKLVIVGLVRFLIWMIRKFV